MATPEIILPNPTTDHPPRPRQWIPLSLRMFVAFVVLLGTGSGLWMYTSAPHLIWDGNFRMLVQVSSDGTALKAVTCQALNNRNIAELTVEQLLQPDGLWSAKSDPFDGKPIEIVVPVSGTESMSGRPLSRTQFNHLVVIGEFEDGTRIGKVVDIPDGRVVREISVTFP